MVTTRIIVVLLCLGIRVSDFVKERFRRAGCSQCCCIFKYVL